MDNIGGPSQFKYEEAVASGAIEKGIAPLCEALFLKGFPPLSSCEGHPAKKGVFDFILAINSVVPVRPFVMFSGTVNNAKSLNRFLREKSGLWGVRGVFNAKTDELIWVLEPNDIRYRSGEVTRKIIDQDLEKLTKWISEFKQGEKLCQKCKLS